MKNFNLAAAIRDLALLLALILPATLAGAHSPDQSYIYLEVTETSLSGKYEANIVDLDAAVGIDADGDGAVTEAEVLARQDAVMSYLQDNLAMRDGQTELGIAPKDITFFSKNANTFAQINFDVTGFEQTPRKVSTTFTGMFDVFGDAHDVLVLLAYNSRTGQETNDSAIGVWLSADNTTQDIELAGLPFGELLWLFIVQGMLHIWLGFDHVLFLCTLLIPAVMVVAGNRWQATESLRPALINVLKLVTAFTVAHSITLSLAALDLIVLPARIVESIIALSIAYVALTILIPRLHRNMFWVVVVFGLFHGFGFAYVLEPISIEPNQKLLTLLGFNLGVELGQIAIVLVVFPILYALRGTSIYGWGIMRAGSVALIAISLIWFEERAFDMLGPIMPGLRSLVGI